MYLPVKSHAFYPILSFLFVIWSNSNYGHVGKNVGFYCNDTAIQKPFNGDSISASFLFLILLGGAPIVIYISEYFCTLVENTENEPISKSQCKHHMKHYYAGFLYVLAVTEILKVSYAELRPHFLDTCQPDMGQIKCSDGLVTNFNCTGTGPKWLIDRDIYKSFPSGHASLSFYTFIFLSVHIKKRSTEITRPYISLWKLSISVLFLVWSLVCCVSRLLDHRHFWWDVLVGVLIGVMGGITMTHFSLKGTISNRKKYS